MTLLPDKFYSKKDRFTQLKGFFYVANIKKFSTAAQKLKICQSTLSMQISSLENDLDTKLFLRKNGLFELTETGAAFFQIAAPIISGFENLQYNFQTAKMKQSSDIQIAGNHFSILHFSPQIIKNIKTYSDNSKIEIRYLEYDEGIDKLVAEQLDFFLYPLNKIPPNLSGIKLCDYNPTLVTHKKSKSQFTKIDYNIFSHKDFIYLEKEKITLPDLKKHIAPNHSKHINLENCDFFMLKKLIEAGNGFTVMPEFAAKHLESSHITTISLQKYKLLRNITLWILYNPRTINKKPVLKIFLENFSEIFFNCLK